MKRLLFCTILIIHTIGASAQFKIAVYTPSTNITRICPTFDSAYKIANSGDYIYLPGGSFSILTPLQKKLHIVGAGHHPDSSSATGRTLTNALYLDHGAEGGSITGCHINGSIFFQSDIDGYSISRCYLTGAIFQLSGVVQNVLIRENYIGNIDICFGCGNPYSINFTSSNLHVYNNVIFYKVAVSNSVLKNNLFLYYSPYSYNPYPLSALNSIVENNIFRAYAVSGNSGNTFYNNINGGVNGNDGNNNQGSGNFYISDFIDTLFVRPAATNYWELNFHLKGATYINAGKDGNEIGLYGGAQPWKDGYMPFNPHISFKNIPAQNDPTGILRVIINVKAQTY